MVVIWNVLLFQKIPGKAISTHVHPYPPENPSISCHHPTQLHAWCFFEALEELHPPKDHSKSPHNVNLATDLHRSTGL